MWGTKLALVAALLLRARMVQPVHVIPEPHDLLAGMHRGVVLGLAIPVVQHPATAHPKSSKDRKGESKETDRTWKCPDAF